MSVMTGAARKGIRFTSSVIDFAVIVAVLLLIAIGFYAMWDSNQVFQRADPSRYGSWKPTDENAGLSFMELQALNPDVFAWLTVYETNIDYPVVQCREGNNMTYISTNVLGEYSMSGAIFLDVKNCSSFSDFNSMIHGHHMDKEVMFGQLEFFAQEDYFNERPYGTLYFDGREHTVEFFAFIQADAYDAHIYRLALEDDEERQEYLDMLLDIALYTRDIPVTIDDNIILLNTCSSFSTNGRDLLVGRVLRT